MIECADVINFWIPMAFIVGIMVGAWLIENREKEVCNGRTRNKRETR